MKKIPHSTVNFARDGVKDASQGRLQFCQCPSTAGGDSKTHEKGGRGEEAGGRPLLPPLSPLQTTCQADKTNHPVSQKGRVSIDGISLTGHTCHTLQANTVRSGSKCCELFSCAKKFTLSTGDLSSDGVKDTSQGRQIFFVSFDGGR